MQFVFLLYWKIIFLRHCPCIISSWTCLFISILCCLSDLAFYFSCLLIMVRYSTIETGVTDLTHVVSCMPMGKKVEKQFVIGAHITTCIVPAICTPESIRDGTTVGETIVGRKSGVFFHTHRTVPITLSAFCNPSASIFMFSFRPVSGERHTDQFYVSITFSKVALSSLTKPC